MFPPRAAFMRALTWLLAMAGFRKQAPQTPTAASGQPLTATVQMLVLVLGIVLVTVFAGWSAGEILALMALVLGLVLLITVIVFMGKKA
jgi:hypothetical protein